MDFTERLSIAMKAMSFDQAKLCKITKMSSGKASLLVNGKVTDPRMSTLVSLSDALDVSIDWLAGRDGFDMHGRIDKSKGALQTDERKLVGDYRGTHDFYKPEISHFAEDMAERHPKNEAHGDSVAAAGKGA